MSYQIFEPIGIKMREQKIEIELKILVLAQGVNLTNHNFISGMAIFVGVNRAEYSRLPDSLSSRHIVVVAI